jgi:octaheme c-type cytochrome (tetrathionate reductase family)
MKKFIQVFLVIIIPEIVIFSLIWFINPDRVPMPFDINEIKVTELEKMPADHSSFDELNKEFTSGQEVTAACLGCHIGRGQEFMRSAHWNWMKKDTLTNGEVVSLGKNNVPNNFCIGVNSNMSYCSKCHTGYGWTNKDFDFKDPKNIDCLACHDNTKTYKKTNGGYPDKKVNLKMVAQKVGHPTKETCGHCHYSGAGFNNGKHGDLEKKLNNCNRDFDVHMNAKGKDMTCTKCHITMNHEISGNMYTTSTSNNGRATCTECHTSTPHKSKVLNKHFNQIACQTCHIPTYAKDAHTFVWWDWSNAAKLVNGEPYSDEKAITPDSVVLNDSKHGQQIWVRNLKPEYVWFNGNTDIVMFDTKITESPLILNKLHGSYADNITPSDPNNPSKIYPVKIMRGKQPYDVKNKTLIQVNTVGEPGSGALWADWNWDKAIKNGMAEIGMPYSGSYDFIETESYWPINHMVSPAEQSLKCEDCHSKKSVLGDLDSIYIPGRDRNQLIEAGGLILIIVSFLGVIGHAILRARSKKKYV